MGISGKSGKVWTSGGALCEVVKFKVDEQVHVKEYGHSQSGGVQTAVAGIKKWEGTVDVKLTEAGIQLHAGENVDLQLQAFNGCGYSGPALIKSGALQVTVENGDPVSETYKFVSTGPWGGSAGGGGGSGSTNGSGSGNDSGSSSSGSSSGQASSAENAAYPAAAGGKKKKKNKKN